MCEAPRAVHTYTCMYVLQMLYTYVCVHTVCMHGVRSSECGLSMV